MEELNEQVEQKFTEFGTEEIEGKKVFVATDETVDREGEVLSIDGWDMGNFKRNPVMLWSHNPHEPNIGKWENIRTRTVNGKKKMTMEPVFHRISDLSKLIADMVDQGFMNTLSVGFRPFQKEGNRYTKQELLETSFVNIPANPEATSLALSKGYGQEAVKTLFGGSQSEDGGEAKDMMGAMDSMDGMMDSISDPAMKKMMKTTVKVMRNQEGRISSLEGGKDALINEIKNLEVALQKVKPVSEPESRPVAGRQAKEKKATALIRLANKALSEHLRLSKENFTNG